MNILPLLSRWRADLTIGGNIVSLGDSPSSICALMFHSPKHSHPNLRESLRQNGIEQLYSHQAASWDLAKRGENIAIVTGTASGKTLCYNIPVIDTMLLRYSQPPRCIFSPPRPSLKINLLVYKSCSSRSLHLTHQLPQPLTMAIAHPMPDHSFAINRRLIITNPDMLHTGILPHHTRWERFFQWFISYHYRRNAHLPGCFRVACSQHTKAIKAHHRVFMGQIHSLYSHQQPLEIPKNWPKNLSKNLSPS